MDAAVSNGTRVDGDELTELRALQVNGSCKLTVAFAAATLTSQLESTLRPELAMVDQSGPRGGQSCRPNAISGSFLLAFAGAIFKAVLDALLERKWRCKTQNGVSR
jgi:hypothetical protein